MTPSHPAQNAEEKPQVSRDTSSGDLSYKVDNALCGDESAWERPVFVELILSILRRIQRFWADLGESMFCRIKGDQGLSRFWRSLRFG